MSKESNGRPQISGVSPAAAIPGGEFQIRGKGLARSERPQVTIGDVSAPIVIGSDSYMVVRVPDGAGAGDLVVESGDKSTPVWTCDVGIQIADSLYPVANPAVDSFGNVYVTFSGSRGQKTPVSVYKIDLELHRQAVRHRRDECHRPGLRPRRACCTYQPLRRHRVSGYAQRQHVRLRRGHGRRHRASASIQDENLYVGDRSGTIFKISRSRQIYVFATLEPSIAAYHLAMGADGDCM